MDAKVPQGSTDTIAKRLLVISAVISALILLAGYLAIQDHVQGQKYNARQAIMSSEERIRKYLNGRRERMRLPPKTEGNRFTDNRFTDNRFTDSRAAVGAMHLT